MSATAKLPSLFAVKGALALSRMPSLAMYLALSDMEIEFSIISSLSRIQKRRAENVLTDFKDSVIFFMACRKSANHIRFGERKGGG